MSEPRTHFNIGGARGWTTACGMESHSFVDMNAEWAQVDCAKCLKRRRELEVEIMFARLGKSSRYRVFGRTRDPKVGTIDTHLGEVAPVYVDKNPWSDRPPVKKWEARRPDGESVAVRSTRQEAAERLVAG